MGDVRARYGTCLRRQHGRDSHGVAIEGHELYNNGCVSGMDVDDGADVSRLQFLSLIAQNVGG